MILPAWRRALARSRSRPLLHYGLPPAVWALAILAGSMAPPSMLPHVEVRFADKWAHFIAYGVLCALIWWAAEGLTKARAETGKTLARGEGLRATTRFGLAVAGLLFGWSDEVLVAERPGAAPHGFILRAAAAFGLAVAWGVLIEFLQMLTPLRTFDLYDILADAFGALMGFAASAPILLRAASRRDGVPAAAGEMSRP